MPTPQRRSRRRGMLMGAAIANSRSNKVDAGQQSAPEPTKPQQSGITPDITKQLTDLKGLLDNGILTQEEFDAKKKQILGL